MGPIKESLYLLRNNYKVENPLRNDNIVKNPITQCLYSRKLLRYHNILIMEKQLRNNHR